VLLTFSSDFHGETFADGTVESCAVRRRALLRCGVVVFGVQPVASSLSAGRASCVYSHDSAEKVGAGSVLTTGEAVCCGTRVSCGEKFAAPFDLLMMGEKACVLTVSS